MDSKQGASLLRDIIRMSLRKQGYLQKKEISCCGITLTQCHALIEIGNAGEMAANECAKLLNLDRSTVSRTLESMVKGNLVNRKENPEDRRYVTIELTDKGLNVFTSINESLEAYYSKIIDSIPSENRRVVYEALPHLLKAITESTMFDTKIEDLISKQVKGDASNE